MSGLAVLFGAFGAHMLKGSVSEESLAVFQTGVQYQMAHGLALLLLAALRKRLACNHRAQVTAMLFVGGVILFSGSLYALALTGVRAFGMITPLGGASFIIGWGVFFVNALRAPEPAP